MRIFVSNGYPPDITSPKDPVFFDSGSFLWISENRGKGREKVMGWGCECAGYQESGLRLEDFTGNRQDI